MPFSEDRSRMVLLPNPSRNVSRRLTPAKLSTGGKQSSQYAPINPSLSRKSAARHGHRYLSRSLLQKVWIGGCLRLPQVRCEWITYLRTAESISSLISRLSQLATTACSAICYKPCSLHLALNDLRKFETWRQRVQPLSTRSWPALNYTSASPPYSLSGLSE